MIHKTIPLLLIFLTAVGALLLTGQNPVDISGIIKEGQKTAIAVPDFRGAGDAQNVMNAFNVTVWSELDGSGILKMIGKTYYPLQLPQQPSDFKPPTPATQGSGTWLTDWSGAPVNANDLAFGYTGVTPDGQLVLYGWLYNLSQATPAAATMIPGTRYFGPLNNDGAKKVAREFAADILKQFGAMSLAGTKIFFVSDRTGPKTLPDGSKEAVKEIWSMDYDGSNQRQLTNYKSTSTQPAVSPDGKMFAFSTYPQLIRDGHTYDGSLKLRFIPSKPVASSRSTILSPPWWRRPNLSQTASISCFQPPSIRTHKSAGRIYRAETFSGFPTCALSKSRPR